MVAGEAAGEDSVYEYQVGRDRVAAGRQRPQDLDEQGRRHMFVDMGVQALTRAGQRVG
jgi:hypothetical protein